MIAKSSFKTIYVSKENQATLQSNHEIVNENYIQRVDIVEILKNQLNIDYNINNYKTSAKQFPENIIPQMNERISTYFPEPLENQWVFRQESFNISKRQEYNIIQKDSQLQLFLIEYRDIQRIDGSSLVYETLKVKQYQVALFSELQKKNSIRVLTNYEITDDQVAGQMLLILLDFYQHPIIMKDFLSSFNKHKIIVPYIPDIIDLVSMFERNRQLPDILEVLDHIITNISFLHNPFTILCHGTSTMLGLRLNQLYPKQSSVIACSPILNYDFIKPSIQQVAKRKRIFRQPQIQQIDPSIISDDDSLDVVDTLLQQTQTNSDSEMIEVASSIQRRFSIKIKTNFSQSQSHVENQVCDCSLFPDACVKCHHHLQKVRSQYEELRNLSQEQYDFNLVSDKQLNRIRSQQNTQTFLEDQSIVNFSVGIESIQQSVVLINDIIKYLYQNNPIFVNKLVYLLNQNRAKSLKIVSDISEFLSVCSNFLPITSIRDRFFASLYGLLVLTPLDHISLIHSNQKLFDKQFFSVLKKLNWMLQDLVGINSDQNIIILVGSHDCLLNRHTLEALLFLQENYSAKNLMIKSLFGAGHEFFIHGSSMIQRLMGYFQ